MDIRDGFALEDPAVVIPWTITVAELRSLFGSHLREVTRGYFTVSCTSLGGLRHELGFHFMPRDGDRLNELEFFRRAYPNQAESFEEFQRHFEAAFGRPDWTEQRSGAFPAYAWNVPGAQIVHYVIDRFGPEEHLHIERRAQ